MGIDKHSRAIRVRGARQNNLRDINVDLPLGQLIVVTGPSGSGKSSFAFDTIYAEGQRRYVETFSPYTRQFLDRMDKPQVDSIDGIPPAIAIEQSNNVKTTRSTVGTITEINDYLKLLMPRVAHAFCPECGRSVRPETVQSILRSVAEELVGRTVLVTFGVDTGEQEKPDPKGFFEFLQSQGYLRVLLYGKVVRTDEEPPKTLPGRVDVIQDRVTVQQKEEKKKKNEDGRSRDAEGKNPFVSSTRFQEAVEVALRLGKGQLCLIDADTLERFPHSIGWHCAHCDLAIRQPTPGLFSFNNPLGACPACRGFGRVMGIDYERALPDRSLSIAEGVVKPFQGGFSKECQTDLLRCAKAEDIDIYCPFEELPKKDQQFVIFGESREATGGKQISREELWEDGRWYGVKGYFDWLETKAYKMHVRVLLSRYRAYRLCPDCEGGRFQPETLIYKLASGKRFLTLPELAAVPFRDLVAIFSDLPLPEGDPSSVLLRDQIVSRLQFLNEVGLGYLSLDRPTRSLSGGEIERVNLTSCLGASLVNTLFVMDEPSVGLHPRDIGQLVGIMQRLRDKGNTLLVVEHEEAIIRAADYLMDIGPGRGRHGGHLTFFGPAEDVAACEESLTGKYLTGEKMIPVPEKRRKPEGFIQVKGVKHHNLQGIDVAFPMGVFCCVTGVSGSGKSSLVRDVLFRNLDLNPTEEAEAPGYCRTIDHGNEIVEAVMVDQSPLARTPRSTPAVYLGVFDKIRELFGMSDASIAAGFTPSSFSFNSGNGRCERCSGLGFEKIEMQFLSDLFLRCPECEGRRYQSKLLQIKVDGKSIHDVLELTVDEAISFFKAHEHKKEITGPLQLMADVGLGYLRLGQPVNALSGGESQRLKLVRRLAGHEENKNTLIVLDEPTTGLHFDDIAMLLQVFQRLVEAGSSLVVIEHNQEVIKCADWVIDLGPEAGDQGGRVVASGTPEDIVKVAISHTGQFLKPLLAGKGRARSARKVARGAQKVAKESDRLIRVSGAREHNLKNITVELPREEMVVITGLSGSGKSTLAFDILFAEGQRRFLDSMSPYARQFVEQLEKPDVDCIEGLPPTVAIEQRVTRGGGKSTVATVTEIYHFLRLFFAKLGTQYCPDCQVPVEKRTVAASVASVEALIDRGAVQVFAPIIRGRKGFHTDVAKWAARRGYEYLLVDGVMQRVSDFRSLARFKEHHIDVLIGEFAAGKKEGVEDVLRKALEVGKGTARVRDGDKKFHILSTEMNCPSCERAFDELDPRLFSFNSPYGWCTHCRGFGEIWASHSKQEFENELEKDLAEENKFEGLEEGESHRCPICKGRRLNEVAEAVRVQDFRIGDLTEVGAEDVLKILKGLKFGETAQRIAKDILQEIRQRLEFLTEVGLGYLALSRSAKTLSGGESQRIRLAAQLGSNLRGVLYVLDEPTIGLHPRDNEKLLDSMEALAKKGNSLLVVEHDEDTMRRASRIIDLGPGAGQFGGEVLVNGPIDKVMQCERSLTGKFLREPLQHPIRGKRRSLEDAEWMTLSGATLHNLQGVTTSFPVNRLTVVTGVSGSGKSSLVRGVLVPAVKESVVRQHRKGRLPNELFQSLEGADLLSAVMEVDQSPIGKTSRSTPGTYVKVFDEIRKLYAQLPEARMRGYTASRFSFNNEGGRCEVCQGQGVIRLEMSFLPTSYMPCEECHGRRFNPQTLEVLYNGKSIGEVMDMTVEEAAIFFASVPKVSRSLSLLAETGLGYLRLGQPSPTLSGGEAQRLKLVAELASRATVRERAVRTGRTDKSVLYVLEEPTIGLHSADVLRLIDVLHRLADEGGTVIVIEHHLDLIAEADYVIDIGPEAGAGGGEIIASGTPEEVASVKRSHTGKFLRGMLKKR